MTSEDRKKRATINDVAEQAGVAIGTVSRYLNGLAIRASNRGQIEKAIEALGFQRNAIAMAMKSERTGIVGFLVPEFDEFHAELLTLLARGFRENGTTMLTYCHDGSAELLRQAMDFFVGQRVDALIMAGSPEAADSVSMLVDNGIPIVIYNNDVSGPIVDRVFVDNTRASARAVGHLIEMGHRKIALAAGKTIDSSAIQRREGYVQALEAHDLPLREDYIHCGGWTLEGGYDAIQKFMALEDTPTAIFSSNYRMTTGVLEWAREHGVSIPGQLAIVSFDDVELFRLYDKGITAVAQPLSQIADAIRSYVMSRLNDENVADIRSRTLNCNIILRGSSGRAETSKQSR